MSTSTTYAVRQLGMGPMGLVLLGGLQRVSSPGGASVGDAAQSSAAAGDGAANGVAATSDGVIGVASVSDSLLA